jgi:hypothetical protein
MPDLLDRLADANPVTSAPTEPADLDALLERIVAAPPPRAGRRRLVRPLLAVGGVACAAAVAFAAIDIAGPEDQAGGVIDRAVAATTGDDVIYHVVERFTGRYETEDRRALDAYDSEGLDLFEDEDTVYEYWFGPGGRHRMTVHDAEGTRTGRLRAEIAVREGRRTWYYDAPHDHLSIGCPVERPTRPSPPVPARPEGFPPALSPGEDAGPQLRALHEQDRLRVVETVEVRGRSAHRLSSDTFRGPEKGHTERVEFLVDAETYLPIQQRNFSTQQGIAGLPRNEFSDVPVSGIFTRDFLVYERLPVTRENLAALEPEPRPGAEVDRHGCD